MKAASSLAQELRVHQKPPFWTWFIDNARPSELPVQKENLNRFSESP